MSPKQVNMSVVNLMCRHFLLKLAATPLSVSTSTWNWGELGSGRFPTFNFSFKRKSEKKI